MRGERIFLAFEMLKRGLLYAHKEKFSNAIPHNTSYYTTFIMSRRSSQSIYFDFGYKALDRFEECQYRDIQHHDSLLSRNACL